MTSPLHLKIPSPESYDALTTSVNNALTGLKFIPMAVKGLVVDTPIAGEQGGTLWSFTQNANAATINATLSTGEAGGLLYDLTGGV